MLYLKERKSLDFHTFPGPFNNEEVKVQEDEVDKLLAAMDGRVHRKKDPQMSVFHTYAVGLVH